MATKTVEVFGIDFEVDYDATKGWPGTYWEPPEPAELILNEIMVGGQDVSEVLHQKVIDVIHTKLEEELAADRRQHQEDIAADRYEERRMREAA